MVLGCTMVMLSSCGAWEERFVPKETKFTEVITVDAEKVSPNSMLEEQVQEITSLKKAQELWAKEPAQEELLQAYEKLESQGAEEIYLALVSNACLPPKSITPELKGVEVSFKVTEDPGNEVVSCIRAIPTVALVGVL